MVEAYGREQIDVIVGLQRGDEAKGRFTEELSRGTDYDIVARFNGGDNAGHTTSYLGEEINTHQVPMGILNPRIRNLITKSSYVNPITLLDEIENLRKKGIRVTPEQLGVSDTAHLILPHHVVLDRVREQSEDKKQGSTARGISFVARDKYERVGARTELLASDSDVLEQLVIDGLLSVREHLDHNTDIETIWFDWFKKAKSVRPFLTDTTEEIDQALRDGGMILAEGAQSFGLDIEHGTYPYVTSSHTTVGGVLNSFGVGADTIGTVFGVAKLFKSSVGAPTSFFPTHIKDEETARKIIGEPGHIDTEEGKTTGRRRQVGWFDIPEINRALQVNGGNKEQQLILSKLDKIPVVGKTVLIACAYEYEGAELLIAPSDSAQKIEKCQPIYDEFPTWDEPISHIREFRDLPVNAKRLIYHIQEMTGRQVTMIGVGPHPGQMIKRNA